MGTIYTRLIARRELATVGWALQAINVSFASCLDIPCGTGKLSPLLSRMCGMVVAADVSTQMMNLATHYQNSPTARMVQADALRLPFGDDQFDIVICLRLFHRVPETLRSPMMLEFRRVARVAVILSMAIRSPAQQIKSAAMRRVRGRHSAPFAAHLAAFDREVGSCGLYVRKSYSVLPAMSAERVFLLGVTRQVER